MKKALSIIALSVTPVVAATPCISLLFNNEPKPEPVVEQHTIKFSASDGIDLVGLLELKVKTKTKWKDVKKPSTLYDQDKMEILGWYNGTTALTDDTEITSDMEARFVGYDPKQTLVAVTIVTAKDTYKDNYFLQTATWGQFKEYYEITQDPVKEGSKFIGWYVGNNKIDDNYVFQSGVDKLTVEAKFQSLQKTVSFSCSNGVTLSSTTPITVNPGTKWKDVTKPTPTVDEQYDGLGWYVQETYEELTDEYEINSNLNARYCAIKKSTALVYVTLVVDGVAQEPRPFIQDYTWGEFKSYYQIYNPSKIGHTFDGWYVDGNKIDDSYKLPALDALTVEAKFNAIEYTVTFTAQQGATFDPPSPTPLKVKHGTKWGSIAKPKVVVDTEEYEGLGWYQKNLGKLDDETVIKNDLIVIYRTQEKTKLKVQVTIDDGIKKETVTFYRGKTWAQFKKEHPLPDPQIKGKKFVGWYYIDTQLTDKWTFPIDKEQITIEAKFEDLFVSDSWANVCRYANEGLDKLKEVYSKDTFIGCEKDLKINNCTYKVRVIGENHDDLADGSGKAALTFELTQLLCNSYGVIYTSRWGSDNLDYTNSTLRANLTGQGSGTNSWKGVTALQMLTASAPELASNLKIVNKNVALGSNYKVGTYSDVLFPLSYYEMYSKIPADVKAEGQTYAYYKNRTLPKERIKKGIKTGANSYFLVTPMVDFNEWVYFVDSNGNFASHKTYNDQHVSFAFCI